MTITRAPFRVYKFRAGVGDGPIIHGALLHVARVAAVLGCRAGAFLRASLSLEIFAQVQ